MKRSAFLFLLLFSTMGMTIQKGSFRDTYLHYVSTHDLIRLFRQKFPDAAPTHTGGCLALSDSNRALLGEANPATGDLSYPGPSPAYVKFFGLCLLNLIGTDLDEASKKQDGLHRFFGPSAVAALKASPQMTALEKPKTILWKDISPEIQKGIARNLLSVMIGPGILKDEEGYLTKLLASFQTDSESKSTYEALSKMLFFIGTQDEFLSY